MSCPFGTIVFPSSRAFWDGDDFYTTEEDSTKKFDIRWLCEPPTSIEKLIIIDSELLIDYVKKSIIKDLLKVCIIQNEKTKKEPSTIYRTKKDLYICVVGVEVDLSQSANFVEKIQDIVKLSKQLMIITCDYISHFQGDDKPDTTSFLRTLYTKNAIDLCEKDIPFLNQPNIVSGVSSGVLIYAEIMNIPAIMYILYTDTFALDSKNVAPLQNLFSSTLDFVLPEYVTPAQGFFSKGNLYS